MAFVENGLFLKNGSGRLLFQKKERKDSEYKKWFHICQKKKKTELAFRKKEKVDSGTCTKREVVMHSLHFGEKSFIPLPQN